MLPRNRRRGCCCLLGLAALCLPQGCASPESAAAQPEARLALIDYGVYYAAIRAQSGETNTVAGYINKITSVPPSEQTDTVCATLGSSFGFRYSLVDPAPIRAQLRVIFDNPPITGASGVPHTNESLTTTVRAGEKHISTYGFEHAYELVPGDWTISVEDGDRVLLRHTFHIRVGCVAAKPA